ncbi:Mitochondrial import inner membrane translocase subunit tim-9 [Ceratocystis lukuohia]|uniref:Mitochondrial import inner membrane translocase subunit n=1 Tax=Ceratocystis lukuohia TaxID=2019550 RepID=A0ABR4MDH8_9PEZI
MSFPGLSATEQRQLEERLNGFQMKQMMGTYIPANPRPALPPNQFFTTMVENCFTACVNDFNSKALSSRENGCITRCVMKTYTAQNRISDRFQEINQTQLSNMQQQ